MWITTEKGESYKIADVLRIDRGSDGITMLVGPNPRDAEYVTVAENLSDQDARELSASLLARSAMGYVCDVSEWLRVRAVEREVMQERETTRVDELAAIAEEFDL